MPARAPALPAPLTATPLWEHGAPWKPEPAPATDPLVKLTKRRLLLAPLTATPLCEQGPPWKPEPVPATEPLVDLTHRRLLLAPLSATPLCEQGPPWKPEPVPATDPLVKLTHRRLLLGAPAPSPAHRRVTAKRISGGHDSFERHGAPHGSRHDGSPARHPSPCRRGRRRSRGPSRPPLSASTAHLGCQNQCPPPIHCSN